MPVSTRNVPAVVATVAATFRSASASSRPWSASLHAWASPADSSRSPSTAATLAPYANGAYVNTLNGDPINRAFPPAKLARLVALKTAYDPDNVFHLNQNIRPGEAATTAAA